MWNYHKPNYNLRFGWEETSMKEINVCPVCNSEQTFETFTEYGKKVFYCMQCGKIIGI